MMKLNNRHLLALTIGASTLPGAVNAQDLTLEEVVVTSQKRVQSLQDVPISVSALTGDKLNDAGIEKIDDLVGFVPNIHMTESGLSTQLRIRGIGSDNNQGFEQSVGLYVDGIYYGRQQLIRAPFLDLERVEVLRGPQSILFGKNSIAGALNMTTAKPTDVLEGYVTATYEPDFNQQELTAVVSGPFSDSVAGRLAIRSFEEDGYIKNSLLNRDEPSRDEKAIRFSLSWDPNEDLSMLFKLEHDTFDVEGRQVEILSSQTAAAGPFAGANYSQILQALGQPGFDDTQDYVRQVDADEFSNNEVNNFTFTLNYQLGGIISQMTEEVVDADRKIERFIKIFIYAAELFQPWLFFMFMEAKNLSKENKARAKAFEQRNINWLKDIIIEGQEKNTEDAIDPMFTSGVLIAMLENWYLKRWHYTVNGTSADEYADYCIDLVRKVI